MRQLENYVMEVNGRRYDLINYTPDSAMRYAVRLYHPLAKLLNYTLRGEGHGVSRWEVSVSVKRGKTKPRIYRESFTVVLYGEDR